ncbi:MAG: pyridoxamine 5'-phosphate oxidase family protein [Chloroflexota bacterium]
MNSNPAPWPPEVLEVVQRFITCEYATLTGRGTPVTFPLTPYPGEDGRTIDVSTGLSYPAKAERARRDPRVGILFSDPVGSHMEKPPVVLVYGLATVRDRDLQAGMDRYVRLNMAKFPDMYKGQFSFLLKRQQWYFTRIWMLTTPVKMLFWPDGDVQKQPEVWTAPEGTTASPSDPAPTGPSAMPWNSSPGGWHEGAFEALKNLGVPVLTVVDQASGGYPVPFRARTTSLTESGFNLDMPAGMPIIPTGPACLTFHSHPEVFVGMQNTAFVGEVSPRPDCGAFFTVERQLGDFSMGRTKLETTLTFLRTGFRLNPQLKAELARRNQPMPEVRLP